MNQLQAYLKRYRAERALRQIDMASKLDITPTWYKEIEIKGKRPGVMLIREIAKVCKISVKKVYAMVENENEEE